MFTSKLLTLGVAVIVLSGCTMFDMALRPSVKSVAEFVSEFKLGTPRQELLDNINSRYNHPFDIRSSFIPYENIKWFKGMREDRRYKVVQHPENILDIISENTWNDTLGFVWQTTEGSGNLYVFYDCKGRYIGFFGYYER